MVVVAQMCAASSGEIHATNNHLLKRMYVKEVFCHKLLCQTGHLLAFL
uniref:Uncharacterized protein n=1 Tax=Sinocyclocheilus grahami TaxID=75366 RepID=A0A672ML97_SINGR